MCDDKEGGWSLPALCAQPPEPHKIGNTMGNAMGNASGRLSGLLLGDIMETAW